MRGVAFTCKYRILQLCYKYIIFLSFQWRNEVYQGLVVEYSSPLGAPFLLEQDSENKQMNNATQKSNPGMTKKERHIFYTCFLFGRAQETIFYSIMSAGSCENGWHNPVYARVIFKLK